MEKTSLKSSSVIIALVGNSSASFDLPNSEFTQTLSMYWYTKTMCQDQPA
jgi:hypothetical protein